MDVRVRLWRKLNTEELMLLNCGVEEDSWESLGLQGDPTSPSWRRSVLGWKDWCWSWNSNTLATWCEELTHWKRPWCWERLRAGGEGDDREWDGWMASLTQWTWVWVDSGSWSWTGRSGVLQFMGSQRVRHNWVTELNWTVVQILKHTVTTYILLLIKWKWKSLSHVPLFVTPWTEAHQTPLSMEFSRQEYWSGLPFPSPGDLSDPGIKPKSPTGTFFTIWATREAQ